MVYHTPLIIQCIPIPEQGGCVILIIYTSANDPPHDGSQLYYNIMYIILGTMENVLSLHPQRMQPPPPKKKHAYMYIRHVSSRIP